MKTKKACFEIGFSGFNPTQQTVGHDGEAGPLTIVGPDVHVSALHNRQWVMVKLALSPLSAQMYMFSPTQQTVGHDGEAGPLTIVSPDVHVSALHNRQWVMVKLALSPLSAQMYMFSPTQQTVGHDGEAGPLTIVSPDVHEVYRAVVGGTAIVPVHRHDDAVQLALRREPNLSDRCTSCPWIITTTAHINQLTNKTHILQTNKPDTR